MGTRSSAAITVGELNEKYAHLEDGESTEDAVLIAGRVMAKRVQGKIAFLELRESRLRHSAVLPHQRARRGGLRGLVRFGRGRLDRRAWHHDAHEARPAVRGGGLLRADEQVAAASAREVPRPDGQGDPLPPALCRPRHEPRGAHHLRAPLQDRLGYPPLHGGPGLLRGGDAVFCMPSSAGRTRSPSSRTSTRSTATTTCASPRSCR